MKSSVRYAAHVTVGVSRKIIENILFQPRNYVDDPVYQYVVVA